MAVRLPLETSAASCSSDDACRLFISLPAETTTTFKDDVTAVAPALRAFSRFLCRERDASDRLVERTIHSAFTTRHPEPVASLKASLFKAMRNDFRAGLRAHHRQQRAAKMRATKTSIRLRHIEEATLRNDLSTALWNLTPRNREAFVLVEAADFSCDAAAHICGCSKATIAVRVSRARHQLATELETAAAFEHIPRTPASTGT